MYVASAVLGIRGTSIGRGVRTLAGITLKMRMFSMIWWEKIKIYRPEIIISIIGLFAINAIFFAKAYRVGDAIDPTTAGQLGDFVGGYVGTAFLLISVLLLYRTLHVQRETSQRQFLESKYFELVKIHRDNVAEMRIKEVVGRNVFIIVLKEFEAARKLVEEVEAGKGETLSDLQKTQLSYSLIFYGLDLGLSDSVFKGLNIFDLTLIEKIKGRLQNPMTRSQIKGDLGLPCDPFEGYQSLLGHYYRQLYQAVKYIDNTHLNIDRYEYIKTLRAQLSIQEQALLLLNSLCPVGRKWWDEKLLIKYKMIKNLPMKYLLDSEFLFSGDRFPLGYFEWQE